MSVSAYTDKGFRLTDFNSDNWHEDMWSNWKLVDALFDAQAGDIALPTVGGTANAITLDYTPDKVLANGLTVIFILTASPTGATTVNVDGAGAVALKILNSAIVTGDLYSGDVVKAVYDGAAFQIITPVRRTGGALKVTVGASGATAETYADDLVVQNSVHAGISILTPNTQKGTLAFGDPEDADAGAIEYDHAANKFTQRVNGVVTSELSSSGLRLVQGGFSFNLVGANDLTITESAANVVRIGSSGAATGIFIDIATGIVTFTKVGATTVTANITRDTKGVFPYFSDPAMVGGRIFMQAAGADPTSLPGDTVYEW